MIDLVLRLIRARLWRRLSGIRAFCRRSSPSTIAYSALQL
jgi:hypothetical protein